MSTPCLDVTLLALPKPLYVTVTLPLRIDGEVLAAMAAPKQSSKNIIWTHIIACSFAIVKDLLSPRKYGRFDYRATVNQQLRALPDPPLMRNLSDVPDIHQDGGNVLVVNKVLRYFSAFYGALMLNVWRDYNSVNHQVTGDLGP